MRILLVEDDRALNRSLVKLLKTQNYSVDPAFDGQEAFRSFIRCRIRSDNFRCDDAPDGWLYFYQKITHTR